MKIVIVGPVYPYRGGIAIYTEHMYRSLASKHDVTMVSFKMQYPRFLYRNEQKDYASDAFKIEGAKYWINTINPLNWISSARKINAMKPDVVVMEWWHPYFAPCDWSMLRLLRRDIKIVMCCHNVLPHENVPFEKLLARMTLRQCDRFIVHSMKDEADLKSIVPAAQYERLPLMNYKTLRFKGIDKETARKQLGLGADEEVLLFFGFIRGYKGVKHLLRAMPAIRAARPKAHLLVVGEFFEGDKQAYLDVIESLQLPQGALTLVDGYLPDEEIEPYFMASDLVVLPYESATQSGIVQIAYGFERPVVVTAVGGLPEVVVDGKTGFVVPPQDEKALAEAVIRFFVEDRVEEFKEGIRSEAYRFSWDRMRVTIEKLVGGIEK